VSSAKKCGVEVIQSKVRRERMGHITTGHTGGPYLVSQKPSSRIRESYGLDVEGTGKGSYLSPGSFWIQKIPPLRKKQLLSEEELIDFREQYGAEAFGVGIGAEAIRKLLHRS